MTTYPSINLDTLATPATLTPRQLAVLAHLVVYRRDHGYSPTMQETADALCVSRTTVFEHRKALAEKGVIRQGRGSRDVVVAEAYDPERQERRRARLEAADRACEAVHEWVYGRNYVVEVSKLRLVLAEWEALRRTQNEQA